MDAMQMRHGEEVRLAIHESYRLIAQKNRWPSQVAARRSPPCRQDAQQGG